MVNIKWVFLLLENGVIGLSVLLLKNVKLFKKLCNDCFVVCGFKCCKCVIVLVFRLSDFS